MTKSITSGLLIAAVLAAATPTASYAQDSAWHDGYAWGEHDGYDAGRDDGYDHGSIDGYRQGHRDGYEQAVRDADDDEDAYDARPYRPRCRRDSGTGGAIVGALAGGLLGRQVARDGLVGVIIGGGVGALAGRAIDRGGQGC